MRVSFITAALVLVAASSAFAQPGRGAPGAPAAPGGPGGQGVPGRPGGPGGPGGRGGFGAPAGPDGAAVFKTACASCHVEGQTAVPPPDVLRTLAPEAIVTSLTSGKMTQQGSALSVAERTAIAQFLTGRPPVMASGTPTNVCTAKTPTTDPARGPSWMGWAGGDTNNARFVPKGGLTAADVPKLKLKWAFAYDSATAARVQPAMAGGKLFVASDNTQLHALDPKTGCVYWTYKAETGIRSALTVGPYKNGARSGYAVFFGDGQTRAYAVDSITGQEIWKRRLDTHPQAGITAALTVHDGKVFVPTQGLNEEGTGGRGGGSCCTFRGALTALDANTGAIVWTSYMVDEPKPRGKNTRTGGEALGPSGGGIWAPATVDAKRRSVYVATGNGYSDPPQKMTDAIVALDLDKGTVKWVYQATPGDQWLGGCGARSGGNPGCPEVQGPDHDFSAAPLLASADGRQLVIVPQKSGLAYALDPDKGTLVWQYRFGQESGLGGVWGAGSDGPNVYFAVKTPGGMKAVKTATGEQLWSVEPPNPRLCGTAARCNATMGAAVTVIPGAVLAGSHDGGLRAYSTQDGKVLWEFDTNKTFDTVNGPKATGASIDGSPLIVVDGMIYLNSGYGGIAARPGNVLLAFGID